MQPGTSVFLYPEDQERELRGWSHLEPTWVVDILAGFSFFPRWKR